MQEQFTDQAQYYVYDSLPRTLSHKTSEFEQLNLKYSYSGISDSSCSNQFMLTTGRSFNQDFVRLNFVEAQKLYETILKLANQLQKRMPIHKDLILYLLYQYKWNEQKLTDAYYDKHVSECSRMNQIILQNQKQTVNISVGQCQTCCTQGIDLFGSYFCNHSYCKQCWGRYIQQNLVHNRIFFPCMDSQCQQYPILLHFVKKISTQLAELYRKKICVNYAILNKSISCCPSDSCSYFCEKSILVQHKYIQCPCGVVYCFKCQRESHQPATCQQVEKWQKLINQQKINQKWIQKYTRKCPTCKQAIQKYVGCNHMKCFCGTQFCFNCIRIWDKQHKQGQQCSLLKKSVKNQDQHDKKNVEQQILGDKIIYISRQMNRDMSIVRQTQQLIIKEQAFTYLKQPIQDLKYKIHNSYINIKWGLVTLYLREKRPIQIQIQKDSISSIRSLTQTVQKIQKKISVHKKLSQLMTVELKQLNYMKEELFVRKQLMMKTISLWAQAWKSLNQAG